MTFKKKIMINVIIMVFDEANRTFNSLKEISLPSVPTKNDKITLNDSQGQGHIYLVYDVHYGESGIDVNVIRLASITDYNSSGYPDIKSTDGKEVWWSA